MLGACKIASKVSTLINLLKKCQRTENASRNFLDTNFFRNFLHQQQQKGALWCCLQYQGSVRELLRIFGSCPASSEGVEHSHAVQVLAPVPPAHYIYAPCVCVFVSLYMRLVRVCESAHYICAPCVCELVCVCVRARAFVRHT